MDTTNLIANIGDASMDHGDPTYGGYLIFGGERPTAEYIQPYDLEGGEQAYEVYRFDLDKCTYDPDTDTLSDNPYHQDMAAWFAPNAAERRERPQDSNLAGVAASCDVMEGHLISWLTGDDLLARARAYECIGDYHGWANFDSYPLTLTDEKARERYANVHVHIVGQTGYMADGCQAISA